MASQLEKESASFHSEDFQNSLLPYYRATLKALRKISRSLSLLRLVFGGLLAAEMLLLPYLFFRAGALSLSFVSGLAASFLTLFTFLVLHFYFQARKPEDLSALRDQFLASCRQLLPLPEGEAHHHLSVAEALLKLANHLDGAPHLSDTKGKYIEPLLRFAASISSSEDTFPFRCLLMDAVIEEHLKQIRVTPTDLEVHASLASAYISFSCLYKEQARLAPDSPLAASWEEKFSTLAELAIEEFKILRHYAPNDPWVHEQLSEGYRSLGKVEEEIEEVEILLQLRPQDKEILYRLGTLYFGQGKNAKGLQIYEELKLSHYKKAETLIARYGVFKKEL